MSLRVFITHAVADRDLARQVAQDVEKSGGQAYLEGWSSRQGASLALDVKDTLTKSDMVIAIVSKHSAQSPWLNSELGMAHALDKKILVVTDTDGVRGENLPPPLRSLPRIRPHRIGRYLKQFPDSDQLPSLLESLAARKIAPGRPHQLAQRRSQGC